MFNSTTIYNRCSSSTPFLLGHNQRLSDDGCWQIGGVWWFQLWPMVGDGDRW
ncbi:hypothetical protein HanRHA438_Chr00c16g0850471 [Helianthus annuus]|nr:hypothetical protein HanPSC8_Chr08g0328001 [Helianthus annuus]KAJ0954470.1 hypothetical protein HanRHA438_Chr00c16g0850471 [Helianthus annuus]